MTKARTLRLRTEERKKRNLIPKYSHSGKKLPIKSFPAANYPCVHRGPATGERRPCESGCGKGKTVPLQQCSLHGSCTVGLPIAGVQCCKSCSDFTDKVLVPEPPSLDLSPKSSLSVVTVASGKEGRDLLELSRPWMEKYAARERADFVVLDWEGYPGWGQSSKFQLFRVLDFYERVVFLDADILGNPEHAPSLFDLVPPGKFGIYDDLPGLLLNGAQKKFLKEYHDVCDSQQLSRIQTFYGNTGVMVFDRSHKEILKNPLFPIHPLHCAEQHLWVRRLHDYDIHFLSAAENYQWWEQKEEGFASAAGKNLLHFSGIRPHKSSESRLKLMKKFLHHTL